MATRQHLLLALVGSLASLGASYPTRNFVVEAPTPQIAKQIGDAAEFYRKQKALEWLGQEMPQWQERCPLHVKVTFGGAGGATSFNFTQGQVWQTMTIEGSLDRLQASVLPHEITHTVFAHYFRCPVPRWADEGGAVLSEDDLERSQHDALVRQILNAGRAFRLVRLFSLRDYPAAQDVPALYAEGYSVASYLVATSGRQAFLAFVAHGMQYGWENAVQTHYHYQSIDQLESAWINYLRTTRPSSSALLARNTTTPPADTAKRVVVRLTVPPFQPLDEAQSPVARGQMPDEQVYAAPPRQATNRPGYLPDYNPGQSPPPSAYPSQQPVSAPQEGWRPSSVRLGQPQFTPEAPATPPAGAPSVASPVGYPGR
ncbi:MAG TPA: hypothetical protein VK395_35000 [Gemmataceae bacterium]|nr:hypothetical protein [Gemmataceae bacterium]